MGKLREVGGEEAVTIIGEVNLTGHRPSGEDLVDKVNDQAQVFGTAYTELVEWVHEKETEICGTADIGEVDSSAAVQLNAVEGDLHTANNAVDAGPGSGWLLWVFYVFISFRPSWFMARGSLPLAIERRAALMTRDSSPLKQEGERHQETVKRPGTPPARCMMDREEHPLRPLLLPKNAVRFERDMVLEFREVPKRQSGRGCVVST